MVRCNSLRAGWSSHRPREIGRTWVWDELEKIARFKKLESSSIVFQNDLAFLRRIGKANLSKFPEIYGLALDIVLLLLLSFFGEFMDNPVLRVLNRVSKGSWLSKYHLYALYYYF
jgi:hypothetical protein